MRAQKSSKVLELLQGAIRASAFLADARRSSSENNGGIDVKNVYKGKFEASVILLISMCM